MSNFQNFLDELTETNATLDFFVDFEKVSKNIGSIEVKLNQLNYLLGKPNLKQAIDEVFQENPNVFSVLNILLAVRENKRPVNSKISGVVEISSYQKTPETIKTHVGTAIM